MKKTVRQRVSEIVKVATTGDRMSYAFDLFLVVLIVLNVLAVCLETVQPFAASWHGFFGAFELFSVVVFSIEFLLRVWSAVEDARFAAPIRGRLRFMLTPLAIVDLDGGRLTRQFQP